MKWWAVGSPNGRWKTHVFPDVLKERILRSLENRGMELPEPGEFLALHEAPKFTMDAGGMCHVDEPFMEYKLGEAIVSIPVTQVEPWLDELKSLPIRLEIGEPYHKAHGPWHCICFRPEDRDSLVEQIEKTLGEAYALTQLENQRWNESMKEINKTRPADMQIPNKPVDMEEA